MPACRSVGGRRVFRNSISIALAGSAFKEAELTHILPLSDHWRRPEARISGLWLLTAAYFILAFKLLPFAPRLQLAAGGRLPDEWPGLALEPSLWGRISEKGADYLAYQFLDLPLVLLTVLSFFLTISHGLGGMGWTKRRRVAARAPLLLLIPELIENGSHLLLATGGFNHGLAWLAVAATGAKFALLGSVVLFAGAAIAGSLSKRRKIDFAKDPS